MKKIVLIILGIMVILGGFLRFYKISDNPPGLYIDEVSIGLNAYDILTTGKDQYAVRYPLFFTAFGEYKMPVYIYLTSISMAIFGKNEFAIRFPSAFFGTLTIVVLFFLSRNLLSLDNKTKKHSDSIALIASGLLSFSPWHLQFSRAGFEAVIALFFFLCSILFFLYYLRIRKILLLLFSVLFLVITFYSYDGYRLLIPMILFMGIIIALRKVKSKKHILVSIVMFTILSLPLVIFTLTSGGLIRFQETSAFFSNPFSNFWQRLLYDGVVFIKNYLSFFSVTFLFRFGDQINRHQVQGFGLLYIWQLPFILMGIYSLFKTTNKAMKLFVLTLIVIEPFTPSLTLPSPHTLRFLYGVIPYTLLSAIGIYYFISQKAKWVSVITALMFCIAAVMLGYYLDYYYIHYPKDALIDWGGSCKEVAQTIENNSKRYSTIIVDEHVGCIADYFSFYIPKTPITYIATTSAVIEKPATLLVTSDKAPAIKAKFQEKVILPNLNKDTFATFWSL